MTSEVRERILNGVSKSGTKTHFIKQHKWKMIYSPATLRFVVILHASFLRC